MRIPKWLKAFGLTCAFLLLSDLVLGQSDSAKSDSAVEAASLDLQDPPNVQTVYRYDPSTGMYLKILTIGGREVGSPIALTFDEYIAERQKEEQSDYFRQKAQATKYIKGSGIIPTIAPDFQPIDVIFGGGLIEIKPTGSAEVTFGGNFNRVDNPNFNVNNQRNGQFDFGMKMQLNVTGQIGERLKLNWNYDTEANFDFENQMKLNWAGTDDDIIKNIELGNVSLPLNGSLIQGGQNLFGVKTSLQFGKLSMTVIATQQKGETKETQVDGGSQITYYDIQASNYDVNRHFFLGQFFANQYDDALKNLPIVQTGVLINYVEVWVTNRSNSQGNTRNVVGFMDMGEESADHIYRQDWNPTGADVPDNFANDLYNVVRNLPYCDYADSRLILGTDYECLGNARQLNTNEFTINDRLGYISLNQSLNNDEVLMVAYEYTYNGRRFQVGELSADKPSTASDNAHLNLKLIKPTTIKTRLPMWNLMMKNIYSLNTYNLQTEDFTLNAVYADDPSGADLNYLPVSSDEKAIFEKQLVEVLGLDNINKQQEAKPDGVFDLIDGITVDKQKGRIIFPVREPFGDYLRSKFQDPNSSTADYYCYNSLYDSTKWLAEQDVKHNKFFLRGTFKGSASDQIRLQCYNITQGSVRVTANGNLLNEGSDYVVDYTLGTVKIVNQGILNSGAQIKASCESNSLLNIQQKSLVGARFDYKFSEKLILGGTFMHMTERPLTPKVNIGEEPILNSIWGVDATYTTDSRFLTRMVDQLPFVETKAPSSFSFTGEFAHLIPHKPKTMGDRGTSYIDDFEGAETPYDLKYQPNWKLATVPQGQPDLFPETQFGDSAYNSRRARLAWYRVDPVFQSNQNQTPDHISNNVDALSNHYTRSVQLTEVFPTIEIQQGQAQQLPTFDLAFYPLERGQYNYNTDLMNADGTLQDPAGNWGGITRRIETNDFEATNIDYIEIWMMDPFVYQRQTGNFNTGELYINIGSVSEDILSDRRRTAENGLSAPESTFPVDTAFYPGASVISAIVPASQIINKAFDNDPAIRESQDVGYDGMNDEAERTLLSYYLEALEAKFGTNSPAYQMAFSDPSGDNYKYYRDESYDASQSPVLERYKNWNSSDGNSTLDKLDDGTPKSGDTRPNDEDVNEDHTVNMLEEYYQYKIVIHPAAFKVGQNYVTDSVVATPDLINPGHVPSQVTWYQLKIPVRQFEKKVGGIQDFKSIRFMRVYMKGFEDTAVIRFANFQLVRADWRRYLNTLKSPPKVGPPIDPNDQTKLVVSTVNIVENSGRQPIPYKLPPEFSREYDPSQIGSVQQNEQSLSLAVCDLDKSDARGAFRTLNLDIRNYKTLKMFIHAESELAQDNDVIAIIRIGTDLENNYYQYEIPLKLTPYGSSDPSAIWPAINNLEVELERFYDIKLQRQKAGLGPSDYFSVTLPNGHRMSIVGLPDLSNCRTILLGVKNAANSTQESLCAEVWFNEFRVVDFVNKGGYAANARMVAKLADFSTITLSGNYQSIGFGAVDKKLNERNLNETFQYDISANFELGKFFPQKSGISIPMYLGWNENIVNPKYYPLNPDILMRTALNNAQTPEEKEEIRKAAQDYTSRYSLNFTNVKKNRTGGGDMHFYDIENFNYSFAYQHLYRRNQMIEFNDVKTYRSSLGYNFAMRPEYWEPFKKLKTKKPLPFIKSFNLALRPTNMFFSLNVDRRYAITKNRNNDNFKAIVPLLYDKTFGITRDYGLKWNLARSLTLDFKANASSFVEEPYGALDTKEKKDTMWKNFFNLGRLQSYNQTINANYNIPINKFKFFDWITLTSKYSVSYGWTTAPPARYSLGNTIQNSRAIGLNGNFNFISFYNKIPYIRDLNRPPAKGKDGEEPKEVNPAVKGFWNLVTMVKQVQLGVTFTDGTTLPGFNRTLDGLGQNFKHNAPGFPFILGSQDSAIRREFASRGLLTNDPSQNNRYISMSAVDVSGSATLEPIKGFRINVNFQKRQSLDVSSNFRFEEEDGVFKDLNLTEVGTFTMSYGMWNTMFDKLGDNYESAAFDQFKNNRYVIAQRLQQKEFSEGKYTDTYSSLIGQIDDSTNFPKGFSRTHQDVMLYAFLAAYSGKNADAIELTPFQKIPIPNWRINYNGLSNIAPFNEWFSNISIRHGYSSTLNMGSFYQPINYGTDTFTRGKNLVTRYSYQSGITLVERLTPLFGIDLTTKGGISVKFEFKSDRTMTLNLRNMQMVEMRNKEWVIGAGYRSSNVRLPFKVNGARIVLKNDLNVRFDLSLRDGITIVRQIDTDIYQATSGIKTLAIRPTIDYKINDNLNLRMFYNRNVNTPYTSQSFPTALTDFGITLRYTLQ